MRKGDSMKRGRDSRFRITQYMRAYFEEHGYMPSVREIGQGCDINSTSTVQHHMDRLFDTGIIETDLVDEYGERIHAPRAYRFKRKDTLNG